MHLSAKHLVKSFEQGQTVIPVLKDINFTFEHNKTYAITGPSGSGKSTLLHLLAGIDIPDRGSVVFGDQDLIAMTSTQRHHFLNTSVGLIFQLPYLIRELSVVENVMLKGLICGQDRHVAYE